MWIVYDLESRRSRALSRKSYMRRREQIARRFVLEDAILWAASALSLNTSPDVLSANEYPAENIDQRKGDPLRRAYASIRRRPANL